MGRPRLAPAGCIAEDFQTAWKNCDVILTPTTPSAAFAIGEKMDDPIAMYLNDVLTVPASMSGLPAISVPAGLSGDGLPLGLHVIGQPYDAATEFNAVRPRNRRNLPIVLPNFAKGYSMPPKRHDSPTDRGSSAATLENK